MTRLLLSVLVISTIALVSLPSAQSAETFEDVLDDVKRMNPFELKRSALACPVILVGKSCPEENPLYFFKCCGELASECCFRLQDWVICILIFLTALTIISIVVNCIRCMFCSCR